MIRLLRLLGVIAAALWFLSRCRLTLWVAGHAMATVPALQAVAVLTAVLTMVLALMVWRMRNPRSYWSTA